MKWIRDNLIDDDIVLDVLQELRRRFAGRRKPVDVETPGLESEAQTLRAEVERLGTAIVSTTEPPQALVKMMGEREKRLLEVEARIVALRAAPSTAEMSPAQMEQEARKRLAEFTAMMARNPVEARQVLEAIVSGPLVFRPIETAAGKRYRIEGSLAPRRWR